MKHSLSYLCTRPWAITERALATMFDIAAREADIEAVAAKLGRPLENTGNRVEQRGSTAVLSVEGPLFRYANLFTAISGATSVEMLGRDLGTALADPQVESILLNVNSPGGEADGVSELAQMIYEAREKKKVWAYVGGWAASGGYWLASAAERVVMHQSGFAGSIGVIATINDDSKRRERDGYQRIEIVSSQSPLKRVDASTDEGHALLKEMVDSMAAHFIDRVAQYRMTGPAHVIAHYGRGFVIDADRSIKAGMADEIGTYEGTVAKLNGESAGSAAKSFAIAAEAIHIGTIEVGAEEREGDIMADDKQPDVAAERAAAATAEQSRIRAILECEEATGRDALAKHIAFSTRMEPDEARKMLAAAPKSAPAPVAEEKKPDQFAEHMKTLGNPKVGTGTDEPADEVAAEVKRITAFIPSNQRRAS